jgi:hypothetical protein
MLRQCKKTVQLLLASCGNAVLENDPFDAIFAHMQELGHSTQLVGLGWYNVTSCTTLQKQSAFVL